MPLPDLADLKTFARVSYDDEDVTLDALLQAAIEYLHTATGRDFTTNTPDRARVAVLALASFWYDQRVPTADAATVVPFHLRSLIHQLRDWQDPEITEALEALEEPAP